MGGEGGQGVPRPQISSCDAQSSPKTTSHQPLFPLTFIGRVLPIAAQLEQRQLTQHRLHRDRNRNRDRHRIPLRGRHHRGKKKPAPARKTHVRTKEGA